MPTQPVLDDKPQTAEPVSNSAIPIPTDVSPLRHHLISIAAAGLLISFFLPWITMLGAKLTGMDIQKNFSSYKLVCVMPLLAIIAFVMNIAKLPARGICQFAGTSPYVILIYAAYRSAQIQVGFGSRTSRTATATAQRGGRERSSVQSLYPHLLPRRGRGCPQIERWLLSF